MLNKSDFPKIIDESVAEVLQNFSINPEKSPDSMLETNDAKITSSIYLKGGLHGRIYFVLPLQSATKLVSTMLMQELDENSHDVLDGIGEVTNMIIGCIKHRCSNLGLPFEISVPSTLVTQTVKPMQLKNGETLMHHYKADPIACSVILSYQFARAEEKPQEVKPKLSAVELLMQAMAKNQQKS